MELEQLGLSPEQLEVVTKAIQGSADKVRTEYSTKLKEKEEELKKLKPQDKSPLEIELETKLKELGQKELLLKQKETEQEFRDKLKSKGLPEDLAKFLKVETDEKYIDELSNNIGSFLLSGSFKPNNHKKNEGITKEEFRKMNYTQRAELLSMNPDLYNKLVN